MSDEFLSGDYPPTFKFENIGDTISGAILSVSKQEDTDPSGNLKTWPNGQPRFVYPFIIQTDNGQFTVWVRSLLEKAVKEAAREACVKEMVGNHITITFTGYGQSKTKGYAPPKLYSVTIKPAAPASVSRGSRRP